MNGSQSESSPLDRGPVGGTTWFYMQRGEVYGPVSSVDLCAAAYLGFLAPEDFVRRADQAQWLPAYLVQGLFQPTVSPDSVHARQRRREPNGDRVDIPEP